MNTPKTVIALLRGINVGGNNIIPMAELRALCEKLGYDDPRSYIASGNLVLGTAKNPATVETALEAAVAKAFGAAVPILARTAAEWAKLADANPFPDAPEPKRLLLCLPKKPLKAGAVEELMARATMGEVVKAAGGALWVRYGEEMAKSKLSPSALDKAAGSPVTARNWRTVLALRELASGPKL